MNNPKSMMLGWGLLVLAAGGGYYLAKKDINERRRLQATIGTRSPEKLSWQERVERTTTATGKEGPTLGKATLAHANEAPTTDTETGTPNSG